MWPDPWCMRISSLLRSLDLPSGVECWSKTALLFIVILLCVHVSVVISLFQIFLIVQNKMSCIFPHRSFGIIPNKNVLQSRKNSLLSTQKTMVTFCQASFRIHFLLDNGKSEKKSLTNASTRTHKQNKNSDFSIEVILKKAGKWRLAREKNPWGWWTTFFWGMLLSERHGDHATHSMAIKPHIKWKRIEWPFIWCF